MQKSKLGLPVQKTGTHTRPGAAVDGATTSKELPRVAPFKSSHRMSRERGVADQDSEGIVWSGWPLTIIAIVACSGLLHALFWPDVKL